MRTNYRAHNTDVHDFIAGIGAGMVYVSLRALVMMYFAELRGLALGISSLGMTASSAVWSHFIAYLRETYGFQKSFFLIGAVLMHLTPLSFFLKVPPWSAAFKKNNKKSNTTAGLGVVSKEYNTFEASSQPVPRTKRLQISVTKISMLCRRPVFYIVVLSYSLTLSCYLFISQTMLDFATDKGIVLSDAVWLTTYCSITNALGHIFLPLLVDRGYIGHTKMLGLCFVMLGAACFAAPHVVSFGLIAVVFMTVTLISPNCVIFNDMQTVRYFGVERLALFSGFGGLITSPVQLSGPSLIRE